jgi:hypothetical protein
MPDETAPLFNVTMWVGQGAVARHFIGSADAQATRAHRFCGGGGLHLRLPRAANGRHVEQEAHGLRGRGGPCPKAVEASGKHSAK